MMPIPAKARKNRAVVLAIWALLGLASTAGAQPTDSTSEQVAIALYERGLFLFGTGDYENARKLLTESLERSPVGKVSEDAATLLQQIATRSQHGDSALEADIVDPYTPPVDAQGSIADRPLDPYGNGDQRASVIDPYAQNSGTQHVSPPHLRVADWGLVGWSGTYGFIVGAALAGPRDGSGNLGGGVVAGILGFAGGAATSYWLSEPYPLTSGQASLVASSGTWASSSAALLGDIFTGRDTSITIATRFAAVGGALGVGAGAWAGRRTQPRAQQVAVANSLAAYGTGLGLLLGVAMAPPRTEAYSLNAVIGSTAGIAAGYLLRDDIQLDRTSTLLVDAGAVVGAAAPWVLVYPFWRSERGVGLMSGVSLVTGVALTYQLVSRRGQKTADRQITTVPSFTTSALAAGTGTSWSSVPGTRILVPIVSGAF